MNLSTDREALTRELRKGANTVLVLSPGSAKVWHTIDAKSFLSKLESVSGAARMWVVEWIDSGGGVFWIWSINEGKE